MITTKFIRLHSKALQILEAIQEVNNRIEENKIMIAGYDRGKSYITPRSWYAERLGINKAIKSRLVSSYSKTVSSICEDTLAKCYNELQSA